MKNLIFTVLVVFITVSLLATDFNSMTKEEQQKIQVKYQKLASPGEEHLNLAELAGEWETTTNIWMMPGSEPITTKGKSENKMILGGRFLQINASSGGGIMASEGLTIIGYDRRFNHYTMTGYDTWGTYYIRAIGNYTEEKILELKGEDFDPIIDMKQIYNMKIITYDKDKYTTEIWFNDFHTSDNSPFKMVEIKSSRVK